MMYYVVHDFYDLQDGDYIYRVGDKYPREGYEPDEKRIKELSGKANKIGKKLIEKAEAKKAKATKKKSAEK